MLTNPVKVKSASPSFAESPVPIRLDRIMLVSTQQERKDVTVGLTGGLVCFIDIAGTKPSKFVLLLEKPCKSQADEPVLNTRDLFNYRATIAFRNKARPDEYQSLVWYWCHICPRPSLLIRQNGVHHSTL